ncbi:hypothetical protein Val02_00940 [Virgisporangium aliadipatigenens]|uniref:Hydrolytic protein n=1 Tax=Virgisporangium aliadipatigenens TaxID=741659 RepID=A0A8J3YFR6_9ACTN|nr:hypothetical protein [Virgisporangium aliadipatigenens]GIJ43208.1 hypothetical protein Val02_00940 [Virgisporangium aliadipatigenens]
MVALPLKVGITPERASATAGDTLPLQVSVRNTSDVVEHYVFDLRGLPAGATVAVEPEITKLRPGETAPATIKLTLPSTPPPPAGEYVVGVLAQSRYRDEVSRCAELALTVPPTQQVAVRVQPEVFTGKRSAKYAVDLINEGNTPLRLSLTATDKENRVRSTFKPAFVTLAPGTSARTDLKVKASVPWSQEKIRALTIGATGDGAEGGTTATFVQRPRVASKLARVAGMVGAVAILAGAIVGGAYIMRERAADQAAANAAAASQAPVGANTPAPAPSPPAAPGGGASASGAAAAGASAGPSAGASGATAPGGAAPGPREVDLTTPANGIVPSDAFRDKGILLSGLPDQGGPAQCKDATGVAVGNADPAGKSLTAARPDAPTQCVDVPVQIRFLVPATQVAVQLVGGNNRRMEVHFRDLSTQIVGPAPGGELTISDDGKRQGIDYVVIRGLGADLTATKPPAALKGVKFTPSK